MKLYTEEQVKKMLGYKGEILEAIMSPYNPIELPSDEEIERNAFYHSDYRTDMESFSYGARWIIEQIKQQGDGN